jgi:hypothetical protein
MYTKIHWRHRQKKYRSNAKMRAAVDEKYKFQNIEIIHIKDIVLIRIGFQKKGAPQAFFCATPVDIL